MGFKRWIDSYNMLMETDWEGNPAIGDSLFRTALLYLCEPELRYADAIDSCFYQGYAFRHPSYKEWGMYPPPEGFYNTCSRDQVIMAFVAIFLNNGAKALPKLRRKFSDKFRQTPDMVWWIKALKGSKFHAWLFCTAKRITLPVLFAWNDLWWKVSKKIYWKVRYPYYALHLGSWMLYTLPDSKIKKRVQNIILKHIMRADIWNLVLWLLNGGTVFEQNVKTYSPGKDFRWQRRGNRLPPGVDMSICENDYPIDKMILDFIYERENK